MHRHMWVSLTKLDFSTTQDIWDLWHPIHLNQHATIVEVRHESCESKVASEHLCIPMPPIAFLYGNHDPTDGCLQWDQVWWSIFAPFILGLEPFGVTQFPYVSFKYLQIVAMLPFVFCVFKITGWWFGTWMLFFHMLGMSSSRLTFTPWFFRGVGQPPTRLLCWANAMACPSAKRQRMGVQLDAYDSSHWMLMMGLGHSCPMQRWICYDMFTRVGISTRSIRQFKLHISINKDLTLNIGLSSNKRWDFHLQNQQIFFPPASQVRRRTTLRLSLRWWFWKGWACCQILRIWWSGGCQMLRMMMMMMMMMTMTMTGWCFGTLIIWIYDFPFSWEWNVIIPTDELHDFSEG